MAWGEGDRQRIKKAQRISSCYRGYFNVRKSMSFTGRQNSVSPISTALDDSFNLSELGFLIYKLGAKYLVLQLL